MSGAVDGSGAMFDRIAERYDLLNRLISGGMDRRWRRALLASLELEREPSQRVLDLATGTGDVAIALAERGASVVGLDPSGEMLAVARRKVAERGLDEHIELVRGRAEELPFPDASFDGASMAFGIRNVPDRPRALAEIARVLRRGGHVAILELGEPDVGLLAPLARLHVHQVVPRLGGWLSGEAEYRYLARSIAAFPPPAEVAAMMEAAGFGPVRIQRFAWGAANLYSAER